MAVLSEGNANRPGSLRPTAQQRTPYPPAITLHPESPAGDASPAQASQPPRGQITPHDAYLCQVKSSYKDKLNTPPPAAPRWHGQLLGGVLPSLTFPCPLDPFESKLDSLQQTAIDANKIR